MVADDMGVALIWFGQVNRMNSEGVFKLLGL